MEIQTYIAGVIFEDRQSYIKVLKVGYKLWLIREPSNQFDQNAIRILDSKKNHLGYIPKKIASTLAYEMDRGVPHNARVCNIKQIDYDGQ